MAKKKDDTTKTGIKVDQKIIKMMYEDYSTALGWSEYIQNNFSHLIGYENRMRLRKNISS